MTQGTQKTIQELETNFAGNLLINTRTITNTNTLFERITSGANSDKTISVTQLSELLVLLEAIATSNRLVYDGTVPQREIDKIRVAEDTLESRIGDTSVFDSIQPESDDQTLALCKAGIQQSSRLLRNRIETFTRSPSEIRQNLKDIRPLNSESARKFADELLKELPPRDEREAGAIDLIRRNPFNGAKCAAGILVTEPDDDALSDDADSGDIRSLCRSVVANRSDDDLCWIVPMFINSFRSNFLNSLGAEHGDAAFFAGPDIERVMDQQIFLLGSYVGARLSEDHLRRDILESAMTERLSSTAQFPFLGLLILLTAEDKDPFSVFRTSLDDKEVLLAEFMAQKGGQSRFIHDLDHTALKEFKEAKLEPVFKTMQRRVSWHDSVDRPHKRIIQPMIKWYAFIRPLLKKLAGEFDDDVPLPEGQPGMGAALEYAINDTLLPGEFLRYAVFTHQIRKRLEEILLDRDGLQNHIELRVREVLGCEIVPD